MKLYADTPGRLFRQLFSDLFVLAWLVFWTWLAIDLYHLILKLGVPGQKLASAGDGIAGGLSDAGDKVHKVPVGGDSLAAPFNKAAAGARGLADAGREQVAIVHDLAWILALLLLAVPVAVVLFGWLPLRLRWVRRASGADGLRRRPPGRELLALRALANQPLRRLSTVDGDPVAAWRRGDPEVVTALANLELKRLGLHRV
jgi:hypothetical protein